MIGAKKKSAQTETGLEPNPLGESVVLAHFELIKKNPVAFKDRPRSP